MPELIKTLALILETIRWHESSKIVTLYTRELGLIKVIARGALRPKSAFGGHLETLNLVQGVIAQKESRELQILTQAQVVEPLPKLKADLYRLPFGLAIAELLKKVFEKGHQDSIFFDFLITVLQALSESRQPQHVFHYFLLKFVSYLGFKPDFNRCPVCGQETFPEGAWFVFAEGALVCPRCTSGVDLSVHLDWGAIQFLRTLQNFNHRKIGEFHWQEPFETDVTALLMRYLNFHLGRTVILNALRLLPDFKPEP